MAGSGNYIQLLLSGQVNEFYSISRNTDGEVCILFFLRMFHCIDEFFFAKYVYIQMMCTLVKISVQNTYQIFGTLFVCVAKCIRVDGLGVGNTIQSFLIIQFCYRV